MRETQNDLYSLGIQNDVIRLIPSYTKRILEVRYTGGQTGKALREKVVEEIVGIDVNEEAASMGKFHYNQLIIGDAELG
jgi:hypothetical protein